MSTKTNPQPDSDRNHADLLTPEQLKISGALTLIAMGAVFLLIQSGRMDWGSPWWVIFLAIPGVMMLYSALTTYQHDNRVSSSVWTRFIGGLVLLVLTTLFIVDPTWSFTRNWQIDNVFPFLRDINWNLVWPWFLIVPGAGIVLVAVRERSIEKSIPGIAMIIVGAVFIFNISWDLVWPLAIVALGVSLLLRSGRKHPQDS